MFINCINNGVDLLLSPASGYMNVPGFSYYDEIILFSEAGFSNQDILKMATYNAAKNLGLAHRIGQIKIGFQADLILLSSNPLNKLSSLKKIKGVFYNSNFIDKSKIDYELYLIELKNK